MQDKNQSITINRGTCHLLYAYDIGNSINLPLCQRYILATNLYRISNRYQNKPKYFDFDPQPLVIIAESSPVKFGRFEVSGSVALTLYDFGAVSIEYRIPFQGTLDIIRALSIEIEKNDILLHDSKKRVKDLILIAGRAVETGIIARHVEDYAIFEAYDFKTGVSLQQLLSEAGEGLAQILRAESRNLSAQEITDALQYCISYGDEDTAIVDWNSAMIISGDADDVRAVLELANVELLELRVLDYQLDESIDRSYDLTFNIPHLTRYIPGRTARNLRRISRMQLEGALMLDKVSNAPKLLGDQFLARVYKMAARRFHLSEWNSGIQRKLETMEDFYQQIHNETVGLRMELLEWIIIILIALEIIIPFIPGLLPH